MEAEDYPPLAVRLRADLPAASEEAWLARMQDLLPQAMSKLPAVERYVICTYYFDELPLASLARDLELSPDQTSALIQSALQQLRAHLR